MTNTLNIGVIGAGRIGALHAGHLATRIPGASLAAIADVNASAAEAVAGRYHTAAYSDYRKILEDKSIEAVAICSSTDTHASIVAEAAEAGKHIFCEKPIDLDLAKIDAALVAVQKAGVKMMVGFNRRFDPNFRKVRDLVAEGKVGAVHLLRITSRDPAPPPVEYIKVSGGLFLDMTIHDFDMARYVAGSEVTEVYAAGGVLVDPAIGAAGDIDTATVILRFANGAIGSIDNSRKAVYGYDQRVEVFGSGGMVSVSNNTPDTHVFSDSSGVHSALPLNFFMQRYVEAYVAEMTEFVNCVVNDTPSPVSGPDARVPIVMGMAAKKSLLENRPVKLSEIE